MFDMIALGELLIDFTPAGISDEGKALFERNPGGAPANVLAAAAKLGAKTAFIGKVGHDQFGTFLEKTLKDNHIDVSGLKFSDTVNTTLAFVHLDSRGDRSFSFYRDPGADMMLDKGDIDEKLVGDAKIFHFGSISMTDEPSRSATLKALDIAKGSGVVISFDPNLRPALWKSLPLAKEMMYKGLGYADILKISGEELYFLTSENDCEKGTDILEKMGAKLIFVTLGPKGAFYRAGKKTGYVPTYDIKTVDTTGAGDSFFGAVLFRLKDHIRDDLSDIPQMELQDITEFGNAAGALTTGGRGAIPSMPGLREIYICLKNVPGLIL
jgi:fructokinase